MERWSIGIMKDEVADFPSNTPTIHYSSTPILYLGTYRSQPDSPGVMTCQSRCRNFCL